MTGILWGALGGSTTFAVLAALGDMVSAEVRDRLDHLPHAILRLAARWLDPDQRVTVYEDEWLPELTYILRGDEARPVTRLYHGTRYAVGILVSVRRIACHVHRPAPEPVTAEAVERFVSVITEMQSLMRRIRSTEVAFDVARSEHAAARACPDPQWPELQRTEALVNGYLEILSLLREEEDRLDRLIYDEFGYVRG